MNIIFDNSYESNILKRIIDGYERHVETSGKKSSKEFTALIDHMRSEIDRHDIDQLFDYIGPLHCGECRYTWTSVVGKDAVSAPCPRCTGDVTIPEEKFVRKIH